MTTNNTAAKLQEVREALVVANENLEYDGFGASITIIDQLIAEQEAAVPIVAITAATDMNPGRNRLNWCDSLFAIDDSLVGKKLYTTPQPAPAAAPVAWMTEKDDPTTDPERAKRWAEQMGMVVIPLVAISPR